MTEEALYSEEPFECPQCGQLLDFRCRICGACKAAVEPPTLVRTPPPADSIPEESAGAPPAVVSFPWKGWLVLLGASMLAGNFLEGMIGRTQTYTLFYVLEVLCAVWVYQDARSKNLPTPLRWSLGTLLVWVVVFPWYLARRRRATASCPFVEGNPRLFAGALLAFLLLSLVIFLVYASLSRGAA
jgi:hypothetical protein